MFCRDDWENVAKRYEAWWACQGPVFAVSARRKGSPPPVAFPGVDFAEKRINPKYSLARIADEMLHTYYGGDAYARVFVNFGPGILAGYLGSAVHVDANTVWFGKCLDSWAGREFAFDPNNPWWQRTVRLTEALCQAAQGRFCVSITDLGGVYDVLASLRGTEELLVDFTEVPEALERAADQVTTVWLRCYDELHRLTSRFQPGSACWDGTWSPGRMYVPQSDVSAMLGPRDFRRHDIPRLRRICGAMDHTVYHLDGPDAVRHLDSLLELPALNAIQWIPGAGRGSLRQWVPLLKRIQDGGKSVLCYPGPDDVETLMRQLRPEGLGICCTARDEDEAKALERLAARLL